MTDNNVQEYGTRRRIIHRPSDDDEFTYREGDLLNLYDDDDDDDEYEHIEVADAEDPVNCDHDEQMPAEECDDPQNE
jgi:hypothetical protein